jgi:hypothetical protein
VALPAEIDHGNAEHAYDQLYAAFAAGAPIVIADFTASGDALLLPTSATT